MSDHPGKSGPASIFLTPSLLPRRSYQVRRMSDSLLSSFVVTKPVDVPVAARKARILAALANLEKPRRTRLGKAVTETCRSILSSGGNASVTYGIADSDGQAILEITVVWQVTSDTENEREENTESADASSLAASEIEQADPPVSQDRDDGPAMAVRRVGELLDGFSLECWPLPGAVAALRMNAPPGFELTDADVADWSAFLGESQIEEALRRAEQRRKLLVSELRASRVQDDLTEEAGSAAGGARLVSMLSLVASQTDNGVVILDQDACVTWVNNAFASQWGYQLDDCAGRPFAELIQHGESAESSTDRIRTVFQTGSSDYVELLARQADGTGRWTGISLSPSLDDSETVQRWIVLLRDVTQQKAANDTLAAARDSAEQANRSKSEFLANMSHEIRTPMNAVIGMTELALGTELTPEQHEYLTTVRMSAEALLELLNDILDLSKIEAGKVELDEVDFDLAEVVRDALKALAVKAHSKGLELATRMPMDLPNHLHGDPLRLRQVIINLVGNAIKFTDHGEVVVEFARSSNDEASGKIDLRFTVRDTGIGIPPEGITRIFESFTQVDTSTTRQYGGTGLGLTITSELLRLMGGHIRVESEVGIGSSFHVSVPFHIVDGPAQSFAGRLDVSRDQLEGRTVLVVDDNATNRRILEELLTNWGLRPRIVSGAGDALKELEAAAYYGRPFDLLLVDAMMPGTDGFELVSGIRSREDLNAGTVMMLSSADRADSARRCRELSISSYLVKPVSQSSLLESILNILSSTSATGKVSSQPRAGFVQSGNALTMAPPPEERALVPLRILVADDHEANRVLAQKLLEKRGHNPTHARTGREVLDLFETDSFDLILMDVQMPELDGLQTTATIREKESTTGKHTPIVALTAHAMKGDREKCLAAGMDGYLSKPLRAREMIALIEKLCEPVTTARIGTSAALPNVETPATDAASRFSVNPDSSTEIREPSIDFSGAIDRMDGDIDLLVEQMRFFLQDAPRLLDQIGEALTSKDGVQLQSTAHRLKGLVSSYDDLIASELCLELEIAGRDSALNGAEETLEELRPLVESLNLAVTEFVNRHSG